MFTNKDNMVLQMNDLINDLDDASLEAIGRFVMDAWLAIWQANYLPPEVPDNDEDDEDLQDTLFDEYIR